MSDATLSLVIPVRDRPYLLGECLESLSGFGASAELEIVVVDDGSTPSNRQIQEFFVSDCNLNIVYLENRASKGPSFSRNRGLKVASGSHLMFLDSDDLFGLTSLDALRTNKSDILVFDLIIKVKKFGLEFDLEREIKLPSLSTIRELKGFVPLPTIILPRCIYKKFFFDEDLVAGHDDYLVCWALSNEFVFSKVDQPIVAVRHFSFERISAGSKDVAARARLISLFPQIFCDSSHRRVLRCIEVLCFPSFSKILLLLFRPADLLCLISIVLRMLKKNIVLKVISSKCQKY